MLRAKPHIESLVPGPHGGISYANLAEKGVSAGDILDFSTCCNPYGPPRQVYAALRRANIELYPDPDSSQLVKELSRKIKVLPENLMAASGSTEVIRLAALAYFDRGDTVVIASPTYGEYELACRLSRARIEKYALPESAGFQLNAADFIAFARQHEPAGIFLCNPNNPTGQYLSSRDVRRMVASFPQTLIALDEAYIAFADKAWDSLPLLSAPNILIIRSLTKDFALAGLRLGYGIGSKRLIDNLKKARPPWNVNSAAQQAGLAVLGCTDYLENCLARIRSCKLYLVEQFTALGYQVIPSGAHYFLVRVANAGRLKSRLLSRGFLVRDCTSFGLPDYIRVAPRKMQDCRRLVRAVKALTGEQG